MIRTKFYLLSLIIPVVLASCGNQTVEGTYSEAAVIQTSKSGDKLTVVDSLKFETAGEETKAEVIIDPETKYQEIAGFGGAFTESSAYVLGKMSTEKRAEVMELIQLACKRHPDAKSAEELVPLVYRMKQGIEV